MTKNKNSSDAPEKDERLLARLQGHINSVLSVTLYKNN
jgi:hypothetical protein